MNANLYTLALISALEEEHPLRLAQPDPGTITVNGQIYGIYTTAVPDVPVFDLPLPVAEGEEPEATLQSVIDATAAELQSGTEMIVVNRGLLTPLRDLLDPPPPPEPCYMKRISSNVFLDLFTKEERDAIYQGAMTNIDLQQWKDRAIGADYVDLEDEKVISGLVLLEQAGFLTSERREKILEGVLVE